jgi:hypothetical protein
VKSADEVKFSWQSGTRECIAGTGRLYPVYRHTAHGRRQPARPLCRRYHPAAPAGRRHPLKSLPAHPPQAGGITNLADSDHEETDKTPFSIAFSSKEYASMAE